MQPRSSFGLLAVVAAALVAGCGGTVASKPPAQDPPPAGVSVSVTPPTANIRAGDALTFGVTVTGSSNTAATWSVNDVAGGAAATGTVDAAGRYTAPVVLPNPNTVTVKAVSAADPAKSDASSVTIMNPTPVITGINPVSTNTGNFTLVVTGSKFVSGAQVLYAGSSLPTTFGSATQLTATGSAATAGTIPISVRNPDPGASQSSSVNLVVTGSPQAASCSNMSLGQGANLNGYRPFPDDSLWNKDISGSPLEANSAAIISAIGVNAAVHADFGASQFQGSTIGIPYTVVGAAQGLTPVNYQAYGSESDPGPMPIALGAPIEGYPNPGTGDRHVLVLDNANCFLYELFSSYPQSAAWNADSGAVWDLQSNQQRPYTWTSADAAGLPIFPGLVRYDEVAAGAIRHAIRFTVSASRSGFTLPATHSAGSTSSTTALPMGAKLRLKSSFSVSSYSAANQVILNAMKKYGLILADNGSNMFISGAPDDRWDNNDLHALGNLKASDFEVVQIGTVYTNATAPTGANPQITSFTASQTSVAVGTPVTLSWQTSGALYVIVSPGVGAVRGTSVSVTPAQTTTYTLYATNAFGRTTSTQTITVH